MKKITTATRLYCLFGNPVSHSMGPVLHNTWFEMFKMDAVYLAFGVTDIGDAVAAMRTLDIRGASVTIPFKEDIIPHLDVVDETAAKTGAVNTVVNRNGRLTGYNTDVDGVMSPLKAVCPIQGKSVFILGAGGAAKAAATGVAEEKGRIFIVNRTEARGRQLADAVGGTFVRPDAVTGKDVDVIINTTPLGMVPHVSSTPLDSSVLHKGITVMDIVYNPLVTRLLREAAAAGCATVDGLSMFLAQAALQFRYFTGEAPPLESMREMIINAMEER